MNQVVETTTMSAQQYLAWEELQEDKHEYYHGEIFAMGGARREHALVSLNIASALKQLLRGKPCRAYMSDMKLHVETIDAFFYPDVIVSCDKNDHQADQFLTSPSLIVEVLSDSTEAYDRGAKFTAYRQVASLKEYVIVDIKARTVEFFRRTDENDWLLHVYAGEEICEFVSLDLCIEMPIIFEDIVASQQ